MSTSPRPNILFLMTDQQRFDAMSAHGGKARTPHLDQLAAGGVDLRTHFANAPVCVPSRCTIFSGRYTSAHGVRENNSLLAPHEPHIFKLLKEAGYHLSYTGKNHLLEDAETANFNFFDDLRRVAPTPEPEGADAFHKYQRERRDRMREYGSWASADFHDFPDAVTETGRIGGITAGEVARAPADRPWCVVGSFHDPHAPHVAPRRFESWYPLEEVELPEVDEAGFATKHRRFAIKREAQGSLRATEEDKKRYLAAYYAMVSGVDEQVGRILEALASRPDAENTIVVFISDHGDLNWHYGMHKKDLVLVDHLLRVPCIIHWPRRFGARVVEGALTEHVDLVPTLLELCGIEAPLGIQGTSLVDLLEGRTTEHKDRIYADVCPTWYRMPFRDYEDFRTTWERAREDRSTWPCLPEHPVQNNPGAIYNVPGDHNRCVRTTAFKYIWYGDGFEELYDLAQDPGETRNVAGEPAYAATRAEYRQKLFEAAVANGDPLSPREEKDFRKRFSDWVVASV